MARSNIILTPSQLARYETEWRLYNKDAKRRHMATVTFDEFISIKFGKKQKLKEVAKPKTEPFRRDSSARYKSASSVPNSPNATAKTDKKVYSGTLIKGIATMHKSNAVPILNDDEAKDIARMRR